MDTFDLRDTIKNHLIELRTSRGITQTDVGNIVGKSKTAVASWEQGLSLPDAVTLYHLAQYYGKTMDFFYSSNHDSDDSSLL